MNNKLTNDQLYLINEYLKNNGNFLKLVIKNHNIYTFEFKENGLLENEYHIINLNKKLIEKIKEITDNKVVFNNKSFWLINFNNYKKKD